MYKNLEYSLPLHYILQFIPFSILLFTEALRAVRNLCYDNDVNLEILRKLNVAEVVMGVIRRHQESSGGVLQWLW